MSDPWNNQPAFATVGEFDDLDSFGGSDLKPEHAILTPIDVLADGTYDFEIRAASPHRDGQPQTQ